MPEYCVDEARNQLLQFLPLAYGTTWNGTLLCTVPKAVVTLTNPEVAPDGMVATRKAPDPILKEACGRESQPLRSSAFH
jgi:hypothetical protein